MNDSPATNAHPWIATLQASLDTLETALLKGDAAGVEQASAAMQSVLQQAPRTPEFAVPGNTLRYDMQNAAQRFAQLRSAVLRANAQSERAVASLLPQQALQRQPTYGRIVKPNAMGGAGRGFLRA
jgi:multidrug resistance efflux pump